MPVSNSDRLERDSSARSQRRIPRFVRGGACKRRRNSGSGERCRHDDRKILVALAVKLSTERIVKRSCHARSVPSSSAPPAAWARSVELAPTRLSSVEDNLHSRKTSAASALASDDALTAIVDRWSEIYPESDASPLLVIGRLFRLVARIDARLRPLFAEAGISDGDFDLLAALRRQQRRNELRPGQLADAMIVTSGATSKRIDRLEGQRLVSRRRANLDGRSRIVALTHRGRTTVDRLMPTQLDNQADILSVLSADDIAKLAELLGRLLASLEETS